MHALRKRTRSGRYARGCARWRRCSSRRVRSVRRSRSTDAKVTLNEPRPAVQPTRFTFMADHRSGRAGRRDRASPSPRASTWRRSHVDVVTLEGLKRMPVDGRGRASRARRSTLVFAPADRSRTARCASQMFDVVTADQGRRSTPSSVDVRGRRGQERADATTCRSPSRPSRRARSSARVARPAGRGSRRGTASSSSTCSSSRS